MSFWVVSKRIVDAADNAKNQVIGLRPRILIGFMPNANSSASAIIRVVWKQEFSLESISRCVFSRVGAGLLLNGNRVEDSILGQNLGVKSRRNIGRWGMSDVFDGTAKFY